MLYVCVNFIFIFSNLKIKVLDVLLQLKTESDIFFTRVSL